MLASIGDTVQIVDYQTDGRILSAPRIKKQAPFESGRLGL